MCEIKLNEHAVIGNVLLKHLFGEKPYYNFGNEKQEVFHSEILYVSRDDVCAYKIGSSLSSYAFLAAFLKKKKIVT